MIFYPCIRKTILREDGQSAYDITSIFDDIIVTKVIYLPIYVEPSFKIENFKLENNL